MGWGKEYKELKERKEGGNGRETVRKVVRERGKHEERMGREGRRGRKEERIGKEGKDR